MREYGYHNRTERRRTRSDVRQLTPFVGREEMAILMRRRERARQGEGQLVLIVGEPGLGKSRLIEENFMVGCVIPRIPGSNGAALSYCKTHRSIQSPKLGDSDSAVRTYPPSDGSRNSTARWCS
jgi:hypothetical protein